MPQVDDKLAQSLRQAKSATMNFVFVPKGAADGALLVAKTTIPPKDILQAKERCGAAGPVIRGRCMVEDGVTVFELGKQPPATLAGQLRKVITRDAGLTLHVETRYAADLAEGDAVVSATTTAPVAPDAARPTPPAARPPLRPAPTAAEPPAAPGVDAAAFKARLKEVMPAYQQAAQKAPQRKAELDAIAGKAGAAAKGGDYAGGVALLGGLAETCAAVLKGGAPPTAPDAGDRSAEFKDKFKALRPSFDKALTWAKANAPERAEELEGLQAQAFDEARAKRFDAALPTLDQLTRAVEAALLASEGKEVKTPDAPAVDAEAFKNRLKAVLPLYQEAIAKAPDYKAELTKLATDATNAGKAKDFAGAIALLDQLEARSNSVLRTAGVGAEIEKATGKGNVALRAKMQDWKKAKAKAAAAIGKLKKEILSDPEAMTLSNWEQIKKGAQGINELVTVFDEFDLDLSDALQAIDDAPTPKDREEPKKEALAVVQKYQQTLSDPLYDLIDNGSYGENIKVKALIADELNALAGVLA